MSSTSTDLKIRIFTKGTISGWHCVYNGLVYGRTVEGTHQQALVNALSNLQRIVELGDTWTKNDFIT